MTEALGSTGQLGATERPRRTPGTPCWVSLLVRDLKATEEFYGTLFGWEFQSGPGISGVSYYVHALLDGQEVAGIGQRTPGYRFQASWTPYLATDDADATAEAVRHRGGTVGVGPLDASAAGRLAVACDPAGAVFGIWQAGTHQGFAVSGVPGSHAWSELLTYDAAHDAAFYQGVFGHVPRVDVPSGPDCLTLNLWNGPVASVRGRGRALDRGAHWVTYFETKDLDAAVEQVAALGGKVIAPAQDNSYGRVATVADPEGAVFVLVRTPR